jgi:EAL domain-containing protein (putative c-di-GMP-specific phosphodiesterase class I)
MSRSVLLTAAAVGMLVGISILRVAVAEPGIMLLAVVPITLLGVMYGVRGGLAGAALASAVFLVWAFTRGHPGVVEEIDEPGVFFVLGLVAGIYARGALGNFDPHQAAQLAELRTAIGRGEVILHYQPLADANTRRVVGFEALARWDHPVRGRIGPAEFIPVAEHDERTIWELTLLAVDRALADLSAWGQVADEITISINVSSVNIGRRDLATELSRVLEQHAFPASRLAIEITETALVGLPQEAENALGSLKRLGMAIMLDDFGTGYSSITRLGRLPFDLLKVDLHVIGRPPARDANRILKGMIELAQALGLQVVAEGVEDDDTWRELTRMGCDLIQGFGLSPPLPPDQVPAWLQHASLASGARLSQVTAPYQHSLGHHTPGTHE